MVNKVQSKIIDLAEEDEFVNVLVFAASGVGKTVLGGSDDKVLFIAPEDNGTLSAKRFGSTAKKWPVHSWEDISEAYDYLYDLSEDGQKPLPFNWVVIDSATEMQQMCMRAILNEAVAQNPSRDPDIPAIQDWQKYYEMFKRLVKAFNDLPVNVLWTALEQDGEDEEGETYKVPLLQGKGTQYARLFASWMTAFGYMYILRQPVKGKNPDDPVQYRERRVITWRATPKVMAKDRTRTLEPHTVDLSLKQIRERIEAGPQQPTAGQSGQVPRKRTKPQAAQQETEKEAANA